MSLNTINSSGGKDSQCMTILLSRLVPREQLLVVHAPLGEVEWPGVVRHRRVTPRYPRESIRCRADRRPICVLNNNRLRTGTIVDASIIDAPSSTKNRRRARDPEMHQTKKGKQWYFGMKAHIGVDAGSGLAHSLTTTAANASDVTQAGALLHGAETTAWGDAGYQGVEKRPEHRDGGVEWRVAMKPGRRRLLGEGVAEEAAEKRKASVRAKVEHPFLYVKRHFGYAKVRYRGVAKNRQRIALLLGFSNLLIAGRYATG